MQKTTKTIYITSDKQEFSTEAEAQAHEIDSIEGSSSTDDVSFDIGKWVVANKDAILAILGSRRKPRSDKGKSRKLQHSPKGPSPNSPALIH